MAELKERIPQTESAATTESDGEWLIERVGSSLIRCSGSDFESVPTSVCKGKHVMFYFSASWCGPCRSFTPLLVQFYEEAEKNGILDVEIVFISLDRTAADFKAYFSKMPWLACSDLQQCQRLASSMTVMAVPSLIVLDPTGTVVTRGGVAAVRKDPKGADFPWEGTGESMSLSMVQKVLLVIIIVLVVKNLVQTFF